MNKFGDQELPIKARFKQSYVGTIYFYSRIKIGPVALKFLILSYGELEAIILDLVDPMGFITTSPILKIFFSSTKLKYNYLSNYHHNYLNFMKYILCL